MTRERKCWFLWRTGRVVAKYSLAVAKSPVAVLPSEFVHPTEAYKRIASWYDAQIQAGKAHDEVMQELEQRTSVPPDWRDATGPPWGTFDPNKLHRAWILNYGMGLFLVLLLTMDYLTLQMTIPFYDVAETLAIGLVVEPAISALKLLAEATVMLITLALLRRVFRKLGMESALGGMIEKVEEAMSVRQSEMLARHSVLLSTPASDSNRQSGRATSSRSEQGRLSSRRSSRLAAIADRETRLRQSMVAWEEEEDEDLDEVSEASAGGTQIAPSFPQTRAARMSLQRRLRSGRVKVGELDPVMGAPPTTLDKSGSSSKRFSLAKSLSRGASSFQQLDED